MTEPSKADPSTNENHVLSFGEHLYVERKRQNLSVAEVASSVHLSEKVIDAIERSDITQLPEPTFVQGYLRVYAKHLGISETLVLEEYSNAVPHKLESDLQPRSSLPDEASSDTPFVKMITIALLLVMIVAALYASFGYYKNAIMLDDVVLEQTGSLELPEADTDGYERIENELPVESEKKPVQVDLEPENVEQEVITKDDVKADEPLSAVTISQSVNNETQQVEQAVSSTERKTNNLVADGEDYIELLANQVSWVEVDDANGINLYYALVKQDQLITLKGTAPFKVFLGNAPQVKVIINDVDVNIEKYIRSNNNTAQFSVSVDQQQIVFH